MMELLFGAGRFFRNHCRGFLSCAGVLIVFILSVSFTSEESLTQAKGMKKSGAYYLTEEGRMRLDSPEDLKEGSTQSPSAESGEAGEVAGGVTEEPEVFEDDWCLILINRDHLIPEDYEFELSTLKDNIKSDKRVTRHVLKMIRRAEAEGVKLYVCSPYRDIERQTELFERKVERLIKDGMSEEEAIEAASQTVAVPGASEHQVGLAFDFITEDYTCLDEGFEDTDAGKWLKENAADYGFILRYPRGKEDITGIEYEPWHYRYVGERAAREIMDRGITLEEYDREIGVVND